MSARRLYHPLIVISLWLAGCTASPAAPPTPTVALPPTLTATTRPAATPPAPTPTMVILPTSDDLPLPSSAEGIPLPPGAVMQLGSWHLNKAVSSPDLQQAYFATTLGVAAYDLPEFNQLWFTRTSFNVSEIALSPDGTRLAAYSTAHGEATIDVLRLSDGAQIAHIEGRRITPTTGDRHWPGFFIRVLWAVDSARLYAAYAYGPLAVYDANSGAELEWMVHSWMGGGDGNHQLAYNADGSRLVEFNAASSNRPFLILDALSLDQQRAIEYGYPGWAAWHPSDPDLLAVIGGPETFMEPFLSVYNVATGELLTHTPIPDTTISYPKLRWSANGLDLIVFDLGFNRVFRGPDYERAIDLGTAITEDWVQLPGNVDELSFDPTARLLAMPVYLNLGKDTAVLDTDSLEVRALIPWIAFEGFLPGEGQWWGRDSVGAMYRVRLMGEGDWTQQAIPIPRPMGSAQRLRWSPDGTHLLVATDIDTEDIPRPRATIWDLSSGKAIQNIGGYDMQSPDVLTMQWLNSGEIFMKNEEGVVTLWDSSGQPRLSSRSLAGAFAHARRSPDGRTLAFLQEVDGQPHLRFIRLADGTQFEVDAAMFIVGLDWRAGTAAVQIETLDGAQLSLEGAAWEFPLDAGDISNSTLYTWLTWMEDSQRIAVLVRKWRPDYVETETHHILILDAVSGEPLRVVEATAPRPSCFANVMAAAGSRLAVSFYCGVAEGWMGNYRDLPAPPIVIYDADSGAQLTVLWGHTSEIEDMAFSPDGRLLASSSDDGTVLIWDVP